MDAFDADVLIYAASPAHPLGRRVLELFSADPVPRASPQAGIGSVLLLPEVLAKPTRRGDGMELAAIGFLLAQLDLLTTDRATAELAAGLGARYRLQAADAVHLATAVVVGADRFLTNNQRDFPRTIAEIEITYPADLPDPTG